MSEGIQRSPRTKMILPLRVWTHEATGEPSQLAHTIETSAVGCRLGGLRTELAPGQTITLQRGQKKAFFRVIWCKQLAANEYHAGIEAVDHEKDLWIVESGATPVAFKNDFRTTSSEVHKTSVRDQTRSPKTSPAPRPRLRWSLGFLFLAMTLGLSLYYATLYSSGTATIHSPTPRVPTARDLARLAPRPHFTATALTKAWNPSATRLQVAEVPTGHIIYPVAPDTSSSTSRMQKVRLQIVIAANGIVKQIHALSGQQALAEAAAEAVRFWHYSAYPETNPGTNSAIDRETTVTVSFLGTDAVFLEFPASRAQVSAAAIKQE